MEVMRGRWGTWEELLLGGAVLRHGTRDWKMVAAELHARTLCPFTFTPEVCKAKYEDLERQYSGCLALLEELRKQRMAELRRALEVSEDSIGSLESKLEILKAERRDDCHISHESSQTESPAPYQKLDGVDSYSKETSKDGLSAGSFTEETKTRPSRSHGCQVPACVSAEEIEAKLECSVSSEKERASSLEKLANTSSIGQGVCTKRKRGKRRRKDCSKDVKEGSVGESDFWGSADVLSATRCKDNSTSCSGQTARCFGVDGQCIGSSKDENVDLMKIFSSIAENKCGSVFRRRLDSQKRGRYKRMILQHTDFDTIRSRIASLSITSAEELFRDLLLLANNALVFYSKTTREYKSALLLRNIVTHSLHQHLKNYISKNTINLFSNTSMLNPPVNPRTGRPCNPKVHGKIAEARRNVTKKLKAGEKPSNALSPPSAESLFVTKKGLGGERKARRGSVGRRPENPTKGRKRSRAK